MHGLKAWIGLSIFFLCGLADIWSAEPEVQYNLLTLPSTRQAQLRLAMPARLNYEHAPLRVCVAQLAEHFQVSYWIDRRVDADKPITIQISDSTLGECLSKIAQTCNAEAGLVENVVTIAKPEHLADMQYAAVRLHNQLSFIQATSGQPGASDTKRSNTSDAEMRPLTWPMLTTPAELAQTINSTWKLSIASNLPHDLMNAGTLQPCTVSTQLTLLYSGFGQCAAGKRLSELRILPMPKAGNWQADYSASAISNERVSIAKGKFVDLHAEKAKSLWKVIGPTAAHLELLVPPAPSKTDRPGRSTNSSTSSGTGTTSSSNDPFSKQRFDIAKQSDKPIGPVLQALSSQIGLTVEWDKSLPQNAQQRLVTIEATKLRLDEVLNNLGEQAKLSIKRSGTQVTVTER